MQIEGAVMKKTPTVLKTFFNFISEFLTERISSQINTGSSMIPPQKIITRISREVLERKVNKDNQCICNADSETVSFHADISDQSAELLRNEEGKKQRHNAKQFPANAIIHKNRYAE